MEQVTGRPRNTSMSSPRQHNKPILAGYTEAEMVAEARNRLAHNKQRAEMKKVNAKNGGL